MKTELDKLKDKIIKYCKSKTTIDLVDLSKTINHPLSELPCILMRLAMDNKITCWNKNISIPTDTLQIYNDYRNRTRNHR